MGDFFPSHRPGRHVVLGEQRDLQDLGAGDDDLLAGCGHGFPCDPVNLVEGVRPQVTVICRSDEHLHVDGLLAVAEELKQNQTKMRSWVQMRGRTRNTEGNLNVRLGCFWQDRWRFSCCSDLHNSPQMFFLCR